MRRVLTPAVACCWVVFAVAGCGSSGSTTSSSEHGGAGGVSTASPQSARSGNVGVAYREISIDPAQITVMTGATVTWTDFDGEGVQHNVTVRSGPQMFSSPSLKRGSRYRFTFSKPGVYEYLCTFHPASMVGKVTVVS